jgi:hypothetical protein
VRTTRVTIAGLAVGAALALPSGVQAASVQKPPCKRTFQGKKLPKNSLCVFKLVRGKRWYIPKNRAYYTQVSYFVLAPDGSIVFDEQESRYQQGLQVQSIYPGEVGAPTLEPPSLAEITHPNLPRRLLAREYSRFGRGEATRWVIVKSKAPLYALTARDTTAGRPGR